MSFEGRLLILGAVQLAIFFYRGMAAIQLLAIE
jgi:hypothetical protein